MRHFVSTALLIAVISTLSTFASADGSRPRPRARLQSRRVEKRLPLRAESRDSRLAIELTYAQSAAAWTTVHDLRVAQGNLGAINDVLKREYGRPEEAFTNISLGYSMPLAETGARIHFQVGAEGVGYGLVQNPVVPELHLNAEAVGLFGGGFSFSAFDGGPKLGLGVVAGMGREKRVDATSTDLIESIPLRNGSISLYGLDFDVAHSFQIERDVALRLQGTVRETLFETTTPQQLSSAVEEQPNSIVTHRWKARGELEQSGDFAFFDGAAVALQGIAGPQPLPIELLPRLWDYAHNLYPLPELGAMFGTGLAARGKLSRKLELSAHAGFYGGYVGGDLSILAGPVKASLASYGLENSAAYHVLGERVWQASLTFLL